MKKKISIVSVLFIIIILLIGFPVLNNQSSSKKAGGTYSYSESFPWDVKLWDNASLKCTNNGTTSSEILVSLLGKKDSDSMATSFTVKKGGTLTKKLSSLSELRRKQNSQNGILLVEAEGSNITCKIIKLPFNGSSTIDSNDLAWGTSYIISTHNILKNITDGAKGRIIIYNLGDSPLNLEVQSYTQAGIPDYYKQLKGIGSGRKKVLNLKNITKHNATYHLIPKGKDAEFLSRYFAYLELTDKNGKQYLIKNSQEIDETLIKDVKGVLVVSNTSSVPTHFTYAISSGNKKAYQGNEWLMPHSQRIFNLKKYTKNLASPKMRIEAFSFFKDKKCVYSEEKNDYECFYLSKRGLIAVNYYSKNTQSPKVIKDIYSDKPDEILTYDISDYLTPQIPVECYKSENSDGDGLCDFEEVAFGSSPYNDDSDNDGLKDDIEICHSFTSPNDNDTDDDNYDDYTEYEARTLGFFPISYPNSPSLFSEEGLKMLAEYYGDTNDNEIHSKASLINNESEMHFYGSRGQGGNSYDLFNWFGNGLPFILSGHVFCDLYKCDVKEKICIQGSGFLSQDGGLFNEIHEHMQSCLNSIKGAIGCKGKDECDVEVVSDNGSEQGCTRIIQLFHGHTMGQVAGNVIYINPSFGNTLHNNLCHETLHNMGFSDLYNVGIAQSICSLMQSRNFCMTSYDSYFLQLSKAACELGKNVIEIVRNIDSYREVCEIAGENGESKTGYRFKFGQNDAPCIILDEENNCPNLSCCKKESYMNSCPEDPYACGKCPRNGEPESFQFAKYNPDNPKEYTCCEDNEKVFCNNECCQGACIYNDNNNKSDGKRCCANPIKHEKDGKGDDVLTCCDDNESSTSSDDSANLNNICNKCKDKGKFLIYKNINKDNKVYRCCDNIKANICLSSNKYKCCHGPCDSNGECCPVEGQSVICGGICCHINNCLQEIEDPNNKQTLKDNFNIANFKGECCKGDVCHDKCCNANEVCVENIDENGKLKYHCEETPCKSNEGNVVGGQKYYDYETGKLACCYNQSYGDKFYYTKKQKPLIYPIGICCKPNQKPNEDYTKCEDNNDPCSDRNVNGNDAAWVEYKNKDGELKCCRDRNFEETGDENDDIPTGYCCDENEEQGEYYPKDNIEVATCCLRTKICPTTDELKNALPIGICCGEKHDCNEKTRKCEPKTIADNDIPDFPIYGSPTLEESLNESPTQTAQPTTTGTTVTTPTPDASSSASPTQTQTSQPTTTGTTVTTPTPDASSSASPTQTQTAQPTTTGTTVTTPTPDASSSASPTQTQTTQPTTTGTTVTTQTPDVFSSEIPAQTGNSQIIIIDTPTISPSPEATFSLPDSYSESEAPIDTEYLSYLHSTSFI